MIRTPSCLWELCHSSLPFQSLGLPPSFNQLFVLYHSQRNLSINNNTLSAACIVGFVLPVHQERKRLTKNRKREKSFLLCIILQRPSDSDYHGGYHVVNKRHLGYTEASQPVSRCVCVRACAFVFPLQVLWNHLRRGAFEVKTEPHPFKTAMLHMPKWF